VVSAWELAAAVTSVPPRRLALLGYDQAGIDRCTSTWMTADYRCPGSRIA